MMVYLHHLLILTCTMIPLTSPNERCEPCGTSGTCSCCSHDFAPNLPEIDCQNRELVSIPFNNGGQNSSARLRAGRFTDFNAEYNLIRKIGRTDFSGFPDLRIIRLGHNSVSEIEDFSFGETIFLDELDLSYNWLGGSADSTGSDLSIRTFDGLKFLKRLNLAHNRLSHLGDIFADMPFLEEVRLNHNPGLLTLAHSSFRHSPFLILVDLSVTRLGSEGANHALLFENLSTTGLKILNLSYSHWRNSLPQLTELGASLESLDLSGNSVRSADLQRALGPVPSFGRLRQLVLRDMDELESLPPNLMGSMLNLGTLVISDCPRLQVIGYQNLDFWKRDPIYTFDHIVIRNTSIQTLEQDSLPLRFSKSVDLSFNPWRCDCNLKWLLGLGDVLTNDLAIDMKCHTPDVLRGSMIMTLHEENMTCTNLHNPSQRSIAAKILASVTASLVLAFSLYSMLVLYNKIRDRMINTSSRQPLVIDNYGKDKSDDTSIDLNLEKDPFLNPSSRADDL